MSFSFKLISNTLLFIFCIFLSACYWGYSEEERERADKIQQAEDERASRASQVLLRGSRKIRDGWINGAGSNPTEIDKAEADRLRRGGRKYY